MLHLNPRFSLTAFKHETLKHWCRAGRVLQCRLQSTSANRHESAGRAIVGRLDGCVAGEPPAPSFTIHHRRGAPVGIHHNSASGPRPDGTRGQHAPTAPA